MSTTEINQISFDNKKTAKYLLTAAFIIEFAVAALAVFIGFSLINDGSVALQSAGFDTLIGTKLMKWGVVFTYILIAIVELTRVPLVLSIFRGESLLWKFIGTFSLIIIMGLAVMSMYLAQINMDSYRDGKITSQDYKIDLSNKKIANLEQEINSNSVLDIESINDQYNLRILDIDEERNKQIKPLEEALKRLDYEKKMKI
jgi:cell division protein FtsL